MKRFTLFIMALLGLALGNTASAQDVESIDWSKYAVDAGDAVKETEGVYLCVKINDAYRFINAAGDYGMEAVPASLGLPFYLSTAIYTLTLNNNNNNNVTGYNIRASVENSAQGSFLGSPSYDWSSPNHCVYIDRSNGNKGSEYGVNTLWTLTKSQSSYNGYYLSLEYRVVSSSYSYSYYSNNPYYCHVYSDNKNNNMLKVTTDNDSKSEFLLIPVSKFRKVIKDQKEQTQIDVSGLVRNSSIIRNSEMFWKWYGYNNGVTDTEIEATDEDKRDENGLDEGKTIPDDAITAKGRKAYGAYMAMHPVIGTEINADGYVSSHGAAGAVELQKSIALKQTITGLTPGLYIVTAQAFISNDDDVTAASTSNAYLSANDNKVEVNLLTNEEQNDYKTLVEDEKSKVTETYMKYFRYNVPAAEFIANGGKSSHKEKIYSYNETYKLITVAVNVVADEGAETGTLTIAMVKTSDKGRAYFDNIKLYYEGKYEFGVDAYNTKSTALTENPTEAQTYGIDEDAYSVGRTFNLARNFGITDNNSTAKWNALVLPVNVTVSQLKNAFGDDVKLSKLEGLDADGSCIIFQPVDLTTGSDLAVTAGECYIIKVTAQPKYARGVEHKFYRNMSDETKECGQQTYTGPIYQIADVSRNSKLSELIGGSDKGLTYGNGVVTKTYKTVGGSLEYTGYFYHPENAPKGSYVVNAGKMYHLTGDWNRFVGTMWYLKDPEKKITSMSFDGGTSGITSVDEDNASVRDGKIYDLQGRRVTTPTRGMYIKNGKKYIVK